MLSAYEQERERDPNQITQNAPELLHICILDLNSHDIFVSST